MLFLLLDVSYSSMRGGFSTAGVIRGEFTRVAGLSGAAAGHR